MKKYSFVFFLVLFGLLSCSKVLDTTPLSTTTSSNALVTPVQANSMLAGIYNQIAADGMYGIGLYHNLALGNDESYFGNNAGLNAVVIRTQNNADPACLALWNNAYAGIKNANLLLDLLATSPLDATTIKNTRAEAKFLRGYIYSILVDNFGNVPLRLVPTTSSSQANMERASYASCYDAIIRDLTDAEADLPNLAELGLGGNGHPSKSAAGAALSRVFLKMAGYPLNDSYRINDTSNFVRARYWAKKVINNGFHFLNPSYSQVFINLIQGRSEPREVIWQINYKLDPSGEFTSNLSRLGYVNGPICPDIDTGYCTGAARPMKILWDKYMQDTNDVRRDWSICPYSFAGGTDTVTYRVYYNSKQIWNRYAGKFRREYELVSPKIKFSTGENFPAIRYSDVLLMFAEAENEVNGPTQAGLDAVNLVRNRAGAKAFSLGSFNQSNFRNMIKDERMRELCFEGRRTHDLIRWSTPGYPSFISIMQNDVKKYIDTSLLSNKVALYPCQNIGIKDYFLPIPLDEISNNALITQNPGY